MRLPDYLLTHTVTREPFAGQGATGPTYGPPETHPAFVDTETRTVRAPDGREAVSGTTVYVQLDTGIRIEDRLTVDGRPVRVIEVRRRDGSGLPTPDHIEIVCE